ncbi:hypothetical protein [Cryobacterium sp. AP23]
MFRRGHSLLRALSVTGLVFGSIAFAAPAHAETDNDPVVVSPPATGLVELHQAKDDSWFWQVTLDAEAGYIASWERESGLWSSADEAQAALEVSGDCYLSLFNESLAPYGSKAESDQHNESTDPESSWSTQAFVDASAACTPDWSSSQVTMSNAESGDIVVNIPLSLIGPGTHQLFTLGLERTYSYDRLGECPTVGWEDGYWEWCEIPVYTFSSSPDYFTVTVPFPPATGSVLPGPDVEEGSAFDQTVFSTLPDGTASSSASDSKSVAIHVGLTVALALVLAILIALPTELLNSVMSENGSKIDRFLRWLFPNGRRSKGVEVSVPVNGVLPARKPPLLQRLSRGVSGWWAMPVLLAGSVIAGFAEPNFGVNWMSLRLLITLFVAFVIVNLGGTFFAWSVTRRRTRSDRPRMTARPLFLLLVLVTVLFARLLHVEPALIFGTVLAIDFGSRLSKARSAAVTIVGAIYLLVVGLAAWAGYSALVGFTLESVSDLSRLSTDYTFTVYSSVAFAQVALGELASVLVVEAISTVPIALLPLAFFGGASLWAWKRWVWGLVYAAGLAVYSFVLVPMPTSWETTSEPLIIWIAIFAGYVAFAIGVWAVFYILNKRQSDATPLMEPEPEPDLMPVLGVRR